MIQCRCRPQKTSIGPSPPARKLFAAGQIPLTTSAAKPLMLLLMPLKLKRRTLPSCWYKNRASQSVTQHQSSEGHANPIQLHFARFELDFTLQILRTATTFDLPTEEVINEADRRVLVRYVPLGPTVGIVPWNYPILLACGKIAPALLTGNTIIIKPSPFTPCGDLKLCELGQRFFPRGVLQCLSGDDSLGPWLTAHPGPRKISFTGSSATGKKVMASAATSLKRVTLELGGNDPAIVLDDVDVEDVAPKIATLAFLNSGQICLALKRIFVHEAIFDRFRDAMVKHTETLKLGEGNEEGVFLGPVQNSMQYERVKGFFAEIEKEGQKVVIGGKNPEGKGYFITPTILEKPKDDSRIVVEEPFGEPSSSSLFITSHHPY